MEGEEREEGIGHNHCMEQTYALVRVPQRSPPVIIHRHPHNSDQELLSKTGVHAKIHAESGQKPEGKFKNTWKRSVEFSSGRDNFSVKI